MQCIITAIVAVILLVSVASSCPSECDCTTLFGVGVGCSRRGLDSIPTDLPHNTENLYLHYNKITSIKSDTFNNLTNLNSLMLDHNKITSIKSDTFNNLTNIVSLYLHNNKITSIKSDTFNNLTNLFRLQLQNNDISVIEDKAFNNLPNLIFICLHRNKITSFNSDMFNNLKNLHLLYLHKNKITSIKSDTFNNLKTLSFLYLHNNEITSIKSNTFNNLTHLSMLKLQNNDISVIEDKAFNNLPNLQNLKLQNNDISEIEDKAFNNLPNLQNLRMDHNPIAFVSEHAFENLPQLTTLNFDMYCGGCENILFWRWLKLNQRFSTSITCHDFDGQYLSNVQPNKFTDCCIFEIWSAWGAWSSCSETCGSGVLTRYRTCNNPPPANGGSYCQGNNDETTSCLATPCPVALEEDSSSAAIGIGACIGSTAVVVGLLIVFIYILKRYRLRKAAESAIYDTAGDTRSSKFRSTYIYDSLLPNTESPTHRQN